MVAGWLLKVFEINSAGLNWMRGAMMLDVLLVPLVVFWAIGYEQYLLSAVFGLVWTALADPGGRYWPRVSHLAVFGLIGAGVTALGFGIGGDAWGWVALAAFVVTLVAGLAIAFGVHRFVASFSLNIQFIIVLALANGFHEHPHLTNYTWAQVAAWAGGSALWIALTFLERLIRGRRDERPLVAELPGDTSRHPLTRPVVTFAVVRAVVIGGTVALAFGLNLSHGQWMSIAAIVIFMHAAVIRFWNFAFFTAAIASGVLILLDLSQPSNYGAEGYRVLWTLYGVGIGVLVMLLAGLVAKRKSTSPPQPA